MAGRKKVRKEGKERERKRRKASNENGKERERESKKGKKEGTLREKMEEKGRQREMKGSETEGKMEEEKEKNKGRKKVKEYKERRKFGHLSYLLFIHLFAIYFSHSSSLSYLSFILPCCVHFLLLMVSDRA